MGKNYPGIGGRLAHDDYPACRSSNPRDAAHDSNSEEFSCAEALARGQRDAYGSFVARMMVGLDCLPGG
jgi:hypothetical protein